MNNSNYAPPVDQITDLNIFVHPLLRVGENYFFPVDDNTSTQTVFSRVARCVTPNPSE